MTSSFGSTSSTMTSETRGSSPLDNVTYDLVAILYEKANGLQAFDKYMQDAQGNQQVTQLLQQIQQQDQQCVQQVRDLLGKLLSSSSS